MDQKDKSEKNPISKSPSHVSARLLKYVVALTRMGIPHLNYEYLY
jgi:hypothetical protein